MIYKINSVIAQQRDLSIPAKSSTATRAAVSHFNPFGGWGEELLQAFRHIIYAHPLRSRSAYCLNQDFYKIYRITGITRHREIPVILCILLKSQFRFLVGTLPARAEHLPTTVRNTSACAEPLSATVRNTSAQAEPLSTAIRSFSASGETFPVNFLTPKSLLSGKTLKNFFPIYNCLIININFFEIFNQAFNFLKLLYPSKNADLRRKLHFLPDSSDKLSLLTD
jgi:hypothetical protein